LDKNEFRTVFHQNAKDLDFLNGFDWRMVHLVIKSAKGPSDRTDDPTVTFKNFVPSIISVNQQIVNNFLIAHPQVEIVNERNYAVPIMDILPYVSICFSSFVCQISE
jgi:hypothetical protein